jgi:hypothetical protein
MSNITELPLSNRVVDGYRIGYTLEYLFMEDGPQYKLEIGGPMTLESSEGKITMDPDDLATMGPSMTLVQKKIKNTEISDKGTLTLSFTDDLTLSVYPSEKVDAWSFLNQNKIIVCRAGGEIATKFQVD